MAITLRAGSENTHGAASSLTPTLPAGWQAGDFCVIQIVQIGAGATFSGGTGWSQVGTTSSATNISSATYYRVLQSGDSAPTFNSTNSVRWLWSSAAWYSSISSTLAYDSSASTATAGSATSVTPNSDTVVNSGSDIASVITLAAAANAENTTTSDTYTPSSGWASVSAAAVFGNGTTGSTRATGSFIAWQDGVSGTVTPGSESLTDSASDTFNLAANHLVFYEKLQVPAGVVQVSSPAGANIANNATFTLTFGSNITPGNSVVVITSSSTVAAGASVSVSPASGGDSYTEDSYTSNSFDVGGQFHVNNSSGGYSSITVKNISGAQLQVAAIAYELPGSVTLDTGSVSDNASGSPFSSGSVSTSFADEFWFGSTFVSLSSSSTVITGPSSPWDNSTQVTVETNTYYSMLGCQFASSTGSAVYSGTWTNASANNYWAKVIAYQFTSNAAPPDLPKINPGPTWLKFFKLQTPKPPPQIIDSLQFITASGSLALPAPVYGANSAVIPQNDMPKIQPGLTWLSLFKPWTHKPRLSLPVSGPNPANLPNLSDVTQVNPGPMWLDLFKPWMPKPRPPVPPFFQFQSNPGSLAMGTPGFGPGNTATVYPTGSGGLNMAPLKLSGTVHVPVVASGSMSMSPLAVRGNVHVPVVITSASLSMAPLGIVTPTYNRDLPAIQAGPSWWARFKPMIRKPFQQVATQQYVSATATMALAPMGYADTNVIQYLPFPLYPISLKAEVLINGTWLDITGFVYSRDNIVVTRGLPDETQSATPSQMTLTLNNRDGRFSPLNSNGAYYPYLTRNVQLRLSVVNQASATGVPYSGYRFWGEVSSWPPQWDSSQSDVYCQIVVSGVFRRYVQGAAMGSTLYQYYTSLNDDRTPYAYWPCEDGSQATEIASALPSVPSMTFTGAPQFASNTAFGGSQALPAIAASTWGGETGAEADPPGTGTITNVFPGTYSWTAPPGVTEVTDVVIIGGGGGGGDQNSGATGGGGGGGGGSGVASSVGVTAGTQYEYVVGPGGNTTSGGTGGVGSDSMFTGDTQTITGKGGGGGNFGGSGGKGGQGSTYNGGRGADGSSAGSSSGGSSQSVYGYTGGAGGGTDGGNTSVQWVAPPDITGDVSITALAAGGGGAGGGVQHGSTDYGGSGGGGGALATGTTTVSAGQTVTFQAGNGGAGGSSDQGGGSGGYSGCSDGSVSAQGGGGGVVLSGGAAGLVAAGSGTPGSTGGAGAAAVGGGAMGGGGGGGGSGQDRGNGGNASGRAPGSGGGSAGNGGGWGAGSSGAGNSTPGGTASQYGCGGGGGGEETGGSGSHTGKAGGGGAGGYCTWSWETSDTFDGGGGGGGSSAGSITGGNSGSQSGSGGSAPTGGGAGGSAGATPAGGSPGGGGAGADPGGSSTSQSSPGAGAAGSVSFSWSGGETSPVAADIIRFCLDVDSAGAADGATLLTALTYGTCATLNLVYHTGTGGNLELIGLNSSSVQIFDSGSKAFNANGMPLYVDLELTALNSDTVQWTLAAIKPGAAEPVATYTGTFTGSVGYVSEIIVDASALVVDNATALGQITVQTYADPMTTLSPIVNGYSGETAAARMARLCSQQGLNFTLVGAESDTPQMGPQQNDTFLNVMQSCSDFDRGQLYETRDLFGVGYRTRTNMQGQSPVLMADYTAGELAGTLQPTADDQFTRNDITVTRNGGASYRNFLSSGVMSINTPPNGVGDYTYALTVYADADTQLANLSAWMLSIGTVNEYRYPSIEFDMSRTEVEGLFGTIPDLDIGDYIQVINPPAFLTPLPINQLFWGVTETLSTYTWTIQINTVPESPYSEGNPPTW